MSQPKDAQKVGHTPGPGLVLSGHSGSDNPPHHPECVGCTALRQAEVK